MVCKSCRKIEFKSLFRTKDGRTPCFPLYGKFVAYLREEPSSRCSLCRLFLHHRVPMSRLDNDFGSQEVTSRYHLRAYSALQASRDVNHALIPSGLQGRDNVFFAVVPNQFFRETTPGRSDNMSSPFQGSAQAVEDHGWRSGYICATSSRDHGHEFFEGRAIQSNIDYSILHRWLDLCHQYHQECELWKFQTRDLSSVKVIDCSVDPSFLINPVPKVVPLPINCRYVALSYVWKQSPMPPSEKTQLRIDGQPVPQVVLDAITVTQQLGYNYLWVDR
jgi:hypothetical protein